MTEDTYIFSGIHDANGDRTTSGFNTFFGEGEFFSAIEFGWFPNQGKTNEGLYHFTLWNIDPRRNAKRAGDRGIALTMEQQLGSRGDVVPFLRYAYAHKGLKGIRQNLSIGVGFENVYRQNKDLIGLAMSWGQPSDRRLRNQYIAETFYRIYVTPHTHFTPGIQLILDPAEAPGQDAVAVLGLRLRTEF